MHRSATSSQPSARLAFSSTLGMLPSSFDDKWACAKEKARLIISRSQTCARYFAMHCGNFSCTYWLLYCTLKSLLIITIYTLHFFIINSVSGLDLCHPCGSSHLYIQYVCVCVRIWFYYCSELSMHKWVWTRSIEIRLTSQLTTKL